jgi:hypothetical protein
MLGIVQMIGHLGLRGDAPAAPWRVASAGLFRRNVFGLRVVRQQFVNQLGGRWPSCLLSVVLSMAVYTAQLNPSCVCQESRRKSL